LLEMRFGQFVIPLMDN